MIDFSTDDFRAIENACNAKLVALEVVYKRNINVRPDYAELIAKSMLRYLSVLEKIHLGYEFFTSSSSLKNFLYGSRKLEVVK